MSESVTISPAIKFMFFSLLKSKKQYKDLKKEMGKIQTVTIIIAPGKMFLRVKSVTGLEMDKPFTEAELNSFLKALNIKAENMENTKHIFIMLDIDKKQIKYDQTNKDGTKKQFDL